MKAIRLTFVNEWRRWACLDLDSTFTASLEHGKQITLFRCYSTLIFLLVYKLIFSVFKTLTDQTVIVELKNDLCITGILKSVDQCVRSPQLLASYWLPRLTRDSDILIFVSMPSKFRMQTSTHTWWVAFILRRRNRNLDTYSYFHLKMAVKNCFIRGSVVRYVQLPASAMDTQLLEDATRRG